MKRLVLAGGGHSHLFVLEALAQDPLPDCEVTLINKTLHAPYSGMLPGLIAGLYDFDACHIDLARLAHKANVRFVQGSVIGADVTQQQLSLADGTTLAYDVLSINTGSTPPLAETPGADGAVLSIKPIEDFLVSWKNLHQRLTASEKPCRIAVVGGGVGSVELALAMQHALRTDHGAAHPTQFEIVCDTAEILAMHNALVRRRFKRVLAERGILVRANSRVVAVAGNALLFQQGGKAAFDAIIWVTGATPAPWPRRAGIATNEQGFVLINETLQSLSHGNIFAVGDVATRADQPRPKSGVYAVRQGPPLAINLRRALMQKALVSYAPQQRALALISTGNPYAVASWGPLAFAGHWVWRWKDNIDRRFIERFSVR